MSHKMADTDRIAQTYGLNATDLSSSGPQIDGDEKLEGRFDGVELIIGDASDLGAGQLFITTRCCSHSHERTWTCRLSHFISAMSASRKCVLLATVSYFLVLYNANEHRSRLLNESAFRMSLICHVSPTLVPAERSM